MTLSFCHGLIKMPAQERGLQQTLSLLERVRWCTPEEEGATFGKGREGIIMAYAAPLSCFPRAPSVPTTTTTTPAPIETGQG